MKCVRVFLICCIALMWGSSAVAETTRFFESIQDLPLMHGLVERPDETITFDKPNGRIVESVVEMHAVSHEAVRAYYMQTLPQLGWEPIEGGRFVRAGEVLELAFEAAEGDNFLRILISPR